MASVRLRIPSDPPVSSARVQLLGSLHRRSPHAIGRARATRPRPSSTPLSHRSGQRRTTRGMHVCCRPSTDTCVFYFDPAASNALPIYKSPTSRIESHCHTKIRGTKPGRTIGMRKQEQRRRQCGRAKRTRPRLPGRLFNFHIPSPVRSASATPAGIARRAKAKDNMHPPPSNRANPLFTMYNEVLLLP